MESPLYLFHKQYIYFQHNLQEKMLHTKKVGTFADYEAF